MPCIRLNKNCIVCVPNEPVEIVYRGRKYYFEYTAWAGWVPINKDGSERLARVPNAAWDLLLLSHQFLDKAAAEAAGGEGILEIRAAEAAGGDDG